MITDKETNFLYLADTLESLQPEFFMRFSKILLENKIEYDTLKNTKDIWTRDYMPVQIEKNKFVKFTYNPDYLRNDRLWKETIPNERDYQCFYDSINKIKLNPCKTKIRIDGGNVIKAKDKVILCDKIFEENEINENKLIEEIEKYFQGAKIIFIPWDKSDFTGHADGMVRFLDDKNVLINKYSKRDEEIRSNLMSSLHNAGLKIFDEIPYNPYDNKTYLDATGIYINYLEIGEKIFMPTFNQKEDELAYKKMTSIFMPPKEVICVDSTEIAKDGGVLNCISWNIQI